MIRAIPNLATAPITSARTTSLTARAKELRAVDRQPIWEAPANVQRPEIPAIEIRSEAAIIDVIERRVDPAEGHLIGNQRKEQELRDLFAALSLHEAWEVRRRITEARSGDRLAVSFQRLVLERRDRLVAFLADAGRRAALGR